MNVAITRSQMDKFGFECIDKAYCGKMKEQALTLTEQLRQETTRQRELITLAEEVQRCILYNSYWARTCFVINCAIVTFLFTTLCSGRLLIMHRYVLRHCDLPFTTFCSGRSLIVACAT